MYISSGTINKGFQVTLPHISSLANLLFLFFFFLHCIHMLSSSYFLSSFRVPFQKKSKNKQLGSWLSSIVFLRQDLTKPWDPDTQAFSRIAVSYTVKL